MDVGYGLSIHYIVLNTGSGGQKDISFQLKDPQKKMVVFQVRKGGFDISMNFKH